VIKKSRVGSWSTAADALVEGNRGGPHTTMPGYEPPETVSWCPSCSCNSGGNDADPIPATVLDPFLGAGTTALVAARLGRDWIGIELSPAYAEIARRRLGLTPQLQKAA
jgi:hypothetical protein